MSINLTHQSTFIFPAPFTPSLSSSSFFSSSSSSSTSSFITSPTRFSVPSFSQHLTRSSIKSTATVVVASATSHDTSSMDQLNFLTPALAHKIRDTYGSPVYVYSLDRLVAQAKKALAFPNAYGLTVRFAMKASPNAAILKVYRKLGLHIDASSIYEVKRAHHAGFQYSQISLSTQELPVDDKELTDFIKQGLKINACSLNQVQRLGILIQNHKIQGVKIGLRFNPGLGAGGTGKTNVGGPDSSFGIWHELVPQVKDIVAQYNLHVERIHTHIGSGSDPAVWLKVSAMSLDLVKHFKDTVTTLNLGGGYKVARMPDEKSTDLAVIGAPVKEEFIEFAKQIGTKLHLEIEPGTFLVANSASLVCTAQDVVTTKPTGRDFIKLDTGMTEVLRPSLYAAQHPVIIVPSPQDPPERNNDTMRYTVVGHCCESGDLITPQKNDPEGIADRLLVKTHIGDLCVIEGVGAYCSGMSTKNYNSFPEIAEVMVDSQDNLHLIRKKQDWTQIIQNEVALPDNALNL